MRREERGREEGGNWLEGREEKKESERKQTYEKARPKDTTEVVEDPLVCVCIAIVLLVVVMVV